MSRQESLPRPDVSDEPPAPHLICLDDDEGLRRRFIHRPRHWDFEGTEEKFRAELLKDAREHGLWGHAYEHNFGGSDSDGRREREEIWVSVWRLRDAREVEQ